MKRNFALLFVSLLTIMSMAAQSYSPNNWHGENFRAKDGSVICYAVPDEYPYIEDTPVMNVKVDDKTYVGVYNDYNYWKGNVHFASFDIKNGYKPEVTVYTKNSFDKVEILPHSKNISNLKIEKNKIKFTINEPQQYLTLVFDDNYKGDVLHLFCNEVRKAPKLSKKYDKETHYDSDNSMYYFGPGYWNLADIVGDSKTITIKGNQQVYLAPGAVVNGRIHLTGSRDGIDEAKVWGTGMLVSGVETGVNCLLVDHTKGGTIEDILVHTHRKHCWQTIYSNCKNVNVKNMKIMGTHYASTDGIDVIACQDCSFHNVFVRSSDDCVALKGLGDKLPAESPVQKGLSFTRMQLWNDCNNAFGIGAETRASEMSNIRFAESEILFSYDDPEFHERLDERSALNICCLHGTFFHDIVFENIYVNRCERLIGMGFKDSFWFGSLGGNQSTEGGISGVTFRNIVCPNKSNSTISNQIWLYGWYRPGTPTKTITDITFHNVFVTGNPVLSVQDANFITTNKAVSQDLVFDLHFIHN